MPECVDMIKDNTLVLGPHPLNNITFSCVYLEAFSTIILK